jgi:hypothetical protein
MFEVKYDKNGHLIKDNAKIAELEKAAESVDQQVVPTVEQAQLQQNEVVQEVSPEPQDNALPEESVETPPAVVQEEKKVSNQAQESFKALREKAERAERERDELMRRLQESETTRQQQQPQKQVQEEEDLNLNLNADDFVEGKHLSKFQKKIDKLENQLKEYQQQSSYYTIEQKLKSEFPDIEKVLTADNIKTLQAVDPLEFEAISAVNNMYTKAALSYRRIKQAGIYQDKTYENEKVLVQKNAAKPRPLASIAPQQGESPLSKANAFADGLTADLQKQLWKEMQDIKKAS